MRRGAPPRSLLWLVAVLGLAFGGGVAAIGAAAEDVTLAAGGGITNAPDDSGAIIGNGYVTLGVNPSGELIVEGGAPSASGCTAVGLRLDGEHAAGYAGDLEGTADGAPAEGWGVSWRDASDGSHGMSANQDRQPLGIGTSTLEVSSDGTSATSQVVDISGSVSITHDYAPSANSDWAYECTVTITNTGSDTLTALRYRRVIDWDAQPSLYEAVVSMGFADPKPPRLLHTSNDGFANPDPRKKAKAATDAPLPVDTPFEEVGPAWQGSAFTLGSFPDLPPAESVSFSLVLGATPTLSAAKKALARLEVEAWSTAHAAPEAVLTEERRQPSEADALPPGAPVTFFLGFRGLGGAPAFPGHVEPVKRGWFGRKGGAPGGSAPRRSGL